MAWPLPMREDRMLLFLGGVDSGVCFHSHTAAMNAIFFGRKRWWLLPPDAVHPFDNDLRPAVGGSISGTTRLPTEPLQCEQQAGEVMFVPKKWLHAVSNTAPSIGVAIELG